MSKTKRHFECWQFQCFTRSTRVMRCERGAAHPTYMSGWPSTPSYLIFAENPYYCNSHPEWTMSGSSASFTTRKLGSSATLYCPTGYLADSTGTNSITVTCTTSTVWQGVWATGSNCSRTFPLTREILLMIMLKYSTWTATWCAVNPTYCTGTPPACSNSLALTPVQTLGAKNYYTCANGYASSSGVSNPYFTCNSNTATSGVWSGLTYSCVGTLSTLTRDVCLLVSPQVGTFSKTLVQHWYFLCS